MARNAIFVLVGLLALSDGTVALADGTPKEGIIIDEVWTVAGSPYRVVGDIRVAGLEIQPGVTVQFEGEFVFEVAGILTSVGTEQDSIIFTRAYADTGWKGIFFNEAIPGSELAYSRIEGSINHGILIDSSEPIIRNCSVSKNSVSGSSGKSGGGICSNVALTVTECVVCSNTVSVSARSYARGGGIYGSGSLDIVRCDIIGNTVLSSWGTDVSGGHCYGQGGGIYAGGALTVANSIICGNSASANTGSFVTAHGAGGGIYADTSLTMTNCIVDRNVVKANDSFGTSGGKSHGGGIYSTGEDTLKNTIVSHNSLLSASTRYGGGICVSSGVLELVNCSIAYNSHHGLKNVSGTATATNCILYFNQLEQVSGDATVTYSDIQDGYPGEGNMHYNPVFESDSDLIIVPGSPCIDSGDPSSAYDDICFPPSLGTERNDIGAHGGPWGCGWIVMYEPMIFCPSDPMDASVSQLGDTVCVCLIVVRADTVDVSLASWDDDLLCFAADTLGSYFFTLSVSNDYGQDTCRFTVVVTGSAPLVPQIDSCYQKQDSAIVQWQPVHGASGYLVYKNALLHDSTYECVYRELLTEPTTVYQVAGQNQWGHSAPSDPTSCVFYTDVDETIWDTRPDGFSLQQNYPNPFNPLCEIRYTVPCRCHTSLVIYNILGQKVRVLVDEVNHAGHNAARWDGRDDQGQEMPSGVYIYRLEAGGRFSASKKMILVK